MGAEIKIENMVFYKSYYNSPVGSLVLVGNEDALVGLWIEGQKYYMDNLTKEPVLKDDLKIFEKTKDWLDRYFNKENPSVGELSLAPIGNKFRQSVWKILSEIPYGKLVTYGDIANKIAQKMNIKSMSAQAVGGAVGHNPISIIIPCHRVVGANGCLTGYDGGIDKKIKLLELEGIDISSLSLPRK